MDAQQQVQPDSDRAIRFNLTLPITRIGVGPFSFLCGAPHKNDYAESGLMRSWCAPRLCQRASSARRTPHKDRSIFTCPAAGGGHA